jgi:hypothetical protein
MRVRIPILVAFVGGFPAASSGQPDPNLFAVVYTLSAQIYGRAGGSWSNPPRAGGNGNGLVEPGEGVLFRLRMTMSGAPGGGGTGFPMSWPAGNPPGTSGTGTVAGFWSGDVNLVGNGGAASAAGEWSDESGAYDASLRRRLVTFTAGGGSGIVSPNGAAVTDIQPAQFAPDPEMLDHSHNVDVWRGLWVPSDFAPRSVTWQPGLGSLWLLSYIAVRDSTYPAYPYVIPRYVQTLFGAGVTIAVVPSPGSVVPVMLGTAGVALRRPRRRGDKAGPP